MNKLCNSCEHSSVCKYKNDFPENVELIKPFKITCKEYKQYYIGSSVDCCQTTYLPWKGAAFNSTEEIK